MFSHFSFPTSMFLWQFFCSLFSQDLLVHFDHFFLKNFQLCNFTFIHNNLILQSSSFLDYILRDRCFFRMFSVDVYNAHGEYATVDEMDLKKFCLTLHRTTTISCKLRLMNTNASLSFDLADINLPIHAKLPFRLCTKLFCLSPALFYQPKALILYEEI